jgi:hypothetical protein
MQIDLYTKAVLTIIAVAMSIIALNPWIAPTRVEAAATSQDGVVTAILAVVTQIANGSCPNIKICQPTLNESTLLRAVARSVRSPRLLTTYTVEIPSP